MLMRASSQEAVDYYLSHDYEKGGERRWKASDIGEEAKPFKPVAMRVVNRHRQVSDSVRSIDPMFIEVEYELDAPITGLRVGIYLMSMRGEFVFTSFDTDDPDEYNRLTMRNAGRYISRCRIPADMLNEGRFVVGMNASVFRVKRYFQDANAVVFTVNPAGAPGMQWAESRQGVTRPRLDWQIEEK